MKKILSYGFGAALVSCMAFGSGALATFACIIIWFCILLLLLSGLITLCNLEKPQVRKELTKNYSKRWVTYILVPLYTAGMVYGGFAITAAAYFITVALISAVIISVYKEDNKQ